MFIQKTLRQQQQRKKASCNSSRSRVQEITPGKPKPIQAVDKGTGLRAEAAGRGARQGTTNGINL